MKRLIKGSLTAIGATAVLTGATCGESARTVAAGTPVEVRAAERVCTNTHKVGSTFNATVRSAVNGTDGALIPAGSPVTLRVSESKRSEDSKDNIRLAFDVVSIKIGADEYPITGKVATDAPVEVVRAQSTTDQAKKIGIGAAAGAIAGQLIGKNTRSTVTGAVVGGAAGTAVAMGTADYNGCVPSGAGLSVTLSSPITVKAVAKSTKAGT